MCTTIWITASEITIKEVATFDSSAPVITSQNGMKVSTTERPKPIR